MPTIITFTLIYAVVNALACCILFAKAARPGWRAFIPYYNTYILYELSCGKTIAAVAVTAMFVRSFFNNSLNDPDQPVMHLLGIMLNIGILVLYGLQCHKLSKAFGHGIGFAVGLFFVNPVFMCILAFGKSKYLGINGEGTDSLMDAFTAKRTQSAESQRPINRNEEYETYGSKPSGGSDYGTYGSKPSGGSDYGTYGSKPSGGSDYETFGSKPSGGSGAQAFQQQGGSSFQQQGGSAFQQQGSSSKQQDENNSGTASGYSGNYSSGSYGNYSSSENSTGASSGYSSEGYSGKYASSSYGNYSSSENSSKGSAPSPEEYSGKYASGTYKNYSSSEGTNSGYGSYNPFG